MKLRIRPLTPNRWPALEDLFSNNWPCGACWCMYWRIGSAYRKQPRKSNQAAFREVVKTGPPPGLLAFDGDLAVGWCQLTPRDALPWLDYRKRGVTSALIMAALKAAKRAGARALEAYPLDGDLTPSASSTGYVSTFSRAGFKIVGRHTPPRPIMRHDLRLAITQAPSRKRVTKKSRVK